MLKGAQLYFKLHRVIKVNNIWEQVHRDTHKGAQITHQMKIKKRSQEIFDSIDWNTDERAFMSLTEIYQINTTKAIHWWFPVNTRLNKVDPKNTHNRYMQRAQINH